MAAELTAEIRRYPAQMGEDRIFPPKRGDKSGRQRLEGSFDDLLLRAKIREFRFHDLRHTFASWYMMNGCDLYELAKILGHSNIKMTERYAKLGRQHMAKTAHTAKEIWKFMEKKRPEEAVQQEENGQHAFPTWRRCMVGAMIADEYAQRSHSQGHHGSGQHWWKKVEIDWDVSAGEVVYEGVSPLRERRLRGCAECPPPYER